MPAALVLTSAGTCLVNCGAQDAADARQLCSLVAALTGLSGGSRLSRFLTPTRDGTSVSICRGELVTVALVDGDLLRASQVCHAFELTFAKSLPARIQRDAEDVRRRSEAYSSRTRREEGTGPVATEGPYRAFQEGYLRPLLAGPPPAEAWLRPLLDAGAVRAALTTTATGEEAAALGDALEAGSQLWREACVLPSGELLSVGGATGYRRQLAGGYSLVFTVRGELPARQAEDVVRNVAHAFPAAVVGVPTPFPTALRPVAPAAPRRQSGGGRPTGRFRSSSAAAAAAAASTSPPPSISSSANVLDFDIAETPASSPAGKESGLAALVPPLRLGRSPSPPSSPFGFGSGDADEEFKTGSKEDLVVGATPVAARQPRSMIARLTPQKLWGSSKVDVLGPGLA